jgi:threonine efflux protein
MIAAMTPGPSFLLVSQIAMSRSRGQAMLAVMGIVTSGVLWSSAALLGLAALFATVSWSHWVLQIAGGGYLINLGIQSWRNVVAGVREPAPAPRGGAFVRGLMTDLLNPKCLAFFASVLVLFIPRQSALWVKVGAVATVVTVGFTCYGAVAFLFSTVAVQNRFRAVRRHIERVCGTVMFFCGVALLLTHS